MRHFGADVAEPRAARSFVVDVLRQAGVGSMTLDDAKLVVTELATNAVLHARSSFSVHVRAEESRVRIAVSDASSTPPAMAEMNVTATSGRGLQLVAAVSADWGVEATASGKVVWAELP